MLKCLRVSSVLYTFAQRTRKRKKIKMKNFIEIQNKVIEKYRIKLDPHSKCWRRTHAHVKERRVCKWKQMNSMRSTFTLLHEIGHIETKTSSMRRSESEYYATCWAIDRCKEYGLEIPENILHVYQLYILEEIVRGKRRGGTGYKEMNIYTYAGINKTIKQFKKELSPAWVRYLEPWV